MKYGIELPNHGGFGNIKVLQEFAGLAEDAGWDGVFLWDSVYPRLWNNRFRDDPEKLATVDTWIALAAVAAVTERVRLGPMVTPLARRRPWNVARQAVTLDQLSQGRLVVGVALGSADDGGFDLVGEPTDRRTRAELLDEGLEIIKGLWSGTEFGFEGKHHRLQPMTFLPPPQHQPRIPLWTVAAWPRPRSIARAAALDGVLPITMDGSGVPWPTPSDIGALCDDLLRRRGDLTGYDVVGWDITRFTSLAEESARAREFAAAGATWWIDPAYKWLVHPDPVRALRQRVLAGPPSS